MHNRTNLIINLIIVAFIFLVGITERQNYKDLEKLLNTTIADKVEVEEKLLEAEEEMFKIQVEHEEEIKLIEEELRDYKDSTKELPLEYIGEFYCTAYCCEKYPHICGTGSGNTASGQPIQADVTVASKDMPFGTVLYIEDVGIRIVQDRGNIESKQLDIAVKTHKEASSYKNGKHKVYIIDFDEE